MKKQSNLTLDLVQSNFELFGAPKMGERSIVNDVFVLLQLCDKAVIAPLEVVSFYNRQVSIQKMFGSSNLDTRGDVRNFGQLLDCIPVEVVDWVASLSKDTVATIVFALRFLMWCYSPITGEQTSGEEIKAIKGDLL